MEPNSTDAAHISDAGAQHLATSTDHPSEAEPRPAAGYHGRKVASAPDLGHHWGRDPLAAGGLESVLRSWDLQSDSEAVEILAAEGLAREVEVAVVLHAGPGSPVVDSPPAQRASPWEKETWDVVLAQGQARAPEEVDLVRNNASSVLDADWPDEAAEVGCHPSGRTGSAEVAVVPAAADAESRRAADPTRRWPRMYDEGSGPDELGSDCPIAAAVARQRLDPDRLADGRLAAAAPWLDSACLFDGHCAVAVIAP